MSLAYLTTGQRDSCMWGFNKGKRNQRAKTKGWWSLIFSPFALILIILLFLCHAKKADISIVDLHDEKCGISHIIEASQNYGLFQLINHGVPIELMKSAMEVFEEVFNMTPEEKAKINRQNDINKVCRIYSSTFNYDNEETHNWRDCLRTTCVPLEESMLFWPQKPTRYKDVVGAYVVALKELGSQILECISLGLGLEKEYLCSSELSKDNTLIVNYYPPCPNPNVTLGIPTHTDPSLITILQSGHVPGLQVFKNGEWFNVETPPDSFVVLMGNQIEVISNGKIKAAPHRVVNATQARTSIVFNLTPLGDCVVGPAKALLEAENSLALYKTYIYKEFFSQYSGVKPKGQGSEDVVEALKIKS